VSDVKALPFVFALFAALRCQGGFRSTQKTASNYYCTFFFVAT